MASKLKYLFLLAVIFAAVVFLPNTDVRADYTNAAGHRVDAVTEEGLELHYYNREDDCDTVIVGYSGVNPKVVIPDKIGKHRVLAIDDSAFEGNTVITEVELPDAMKSIEKKAFKNCINLKSVKFGDYLGWHEKNDKKTSVSAEWPLEIESGAFAGCTSLEYVEFTYGVYPMVRSDEESVFAGSGLKEAVLCLSQWDNHQNLFDGSDYLKKITIKSREDGKFVSGGWLVSGIGAFKNLKSLETVEVYNAERVLFGNSYYTSGKEYRETFVNCPKLKTVNLYYGKAKDGGYVYNADNRDSAPFIGSVLTSDVPERDRHYITSSDSSVIEVTSDNKVRGLLHEGKAKLSCKLLPFEVNVIVGDGKGSRLNLKDSVMDMPVKSAAYTGEEIIPYITVEYDGKLLVEGKDYSVECTNNIDIGKAAITVTGMGDYCGSSQMKYSIVPVTVILKSVSRIKSQYVLSWNKNALATGYEVYYSNKKASGYKKLGSTTALSLSSGKLKSGMYIKIRTYKKVGDKKYYSQYSDPVKLN